MDCPFMVERLGHIALRVRDLEKSIAFYEMFGGVLPPHGGGNTRMALGPTGELFLRPEPTYIPEAAKNNLLHFAVEVQTTHEIADVLDYMRSYGAKPSAGPESHSDGRVGYRFLDPDGNEVELFVKQQGR